MATWKKVVVSGSSAVLAGLTVDGTAIVGNLTGNVTGDVTGDLTGNVTGDVTGDVTGNVSGTAGSTTGNAATATQLQTARNINGQSFDGTANITVTAAGSTLSDTVTVAKGGTGLTTIPAGSLIQAATADTVTALTGGSADDGKVVTYDHNTTSFVLSADAGGDVTADSTTTFTNKTIDADATGNVITNIEDANIKALAGIAQSKISNLTTDLAAKAPLASPAFTGTVTGVTATMVGLGSVNDTSDADKPVSTAQQSALNLKADAADPTFTGTMTAAALSVTGNASVSGDLTVAGTASFQNTTNLAIADKYILLNSGSSSTGDGGFVVQQGTNGIGELFGYDKDSGTGGRWGVATAFNADTAADFTPAAFMAAVIPAESANTPTTIAALNTTYNKAGNIYTSTATGNDIWIYS